MWQSVCMSLPLPDSSEKGPAFRPFRVLAVLLLILDLLLFAAYLRIHFNVVDMERHILSRPVLTEDQLSPLSPSSDSVGML